MAKRNRLTKLRINEVSLVDDPANPGAHVTLFKRGEPTMSKNTELTPEALALALEKAEAEVVTQKARADAAEAKLATLAKGEKLDPYADMPPAVAAELRKRDDLVAKQAEELAKLRDGQELGEYVAKAATFKNLPLDAAKVAPILRKAAKALTADEFGELERLLKAGDEGLAKAAVTKALGQGGTVPTSAEAEITKRTQDMLKAQPELTFAKAYTRVLESDGDLYRRYLDEKGGKGAAH